MREDTSPLSNSCTSGVRAKANGGAGAGGAGTGRRGGMAGTSNVEDGLATDVSDRVR